MAIKKLCNNRKTFIFHNICQITIDIPPRHFKKVWTKRRSGFFWMSGGIIKNRWGFIAQILRLPQEHKILLIKI